MKGPSMSLNMLSCKRQHAKEAEAKFSRGTCKLREQSSILVDIVAWLAVSIMLQLTRYVSSGFYMLLSCCHVPSSPRTTPGDIMNDADVSNILEHSA